MGDNTDLLLLQDCGGKVRMLERESQRRPRPALEAEDPSLSSTLVSDTGSVNLDDSLATISSVDSLDISDLEDGESGSLDTSLDINGLNSTTISSDSSLNNASMESSDGGNTSTDTLPDVNKFLERFELQTGLSDSVLLASDTSACEVEEEEKQETLKENFLKSAAEMTKLLGDIRKKEEQKSSSVETPIRG